MPSNKISSLRLKIWMPRSLIFGFITILLISLNCTITLCTLFSAVFCSWQMFIPAFEWRFSFLQSKFKGKLLFSFVWKLEYILDLTFRIATAWMRPVPDIIVVGAAKAGSTALADALMQNENVAGLAFDYYLFRQIMNDNEARIIANKESFFFNGRLGPNFAHQKYLYRAFFPITFGNKLVVDADPCVSWTLLAAKRQFAINPNAKLVFSFRDPSKRAFSNFNMDLSMGIFRKADAQGATSDAFEKQMDLCLENENRWRALGTEYPATKSLPEDLLKTFDSGTGYLHGGHYDDLVLAYLKAGFKLEQMFFVDQQDLSKNRPKVIKSLYSFVGIHSGHVPCAERRCNVGKYVESMSPALQKKLDEYYRTRMLRLVLLTGRRFSFTPEIASIVKPKSSNVSKRTCLRRSTTLMAPRSQILVN